ncbi:hypothetical protein [Opitutus sp. ER46]|uniref:hypothetical protein n=1 Tax=Opitutus sp. ER46 TaxID=2161864 RepID=UPI000D304867|nr:hypothetical protein [Opitutus sp. ER46]PTX91427.1 hypothetical protein DB354_16175 [Opitutus sp. ER46]
MNAKIVLWLGALLGVVATLTTVRLSRAVTENRAGAAVLQEKRVRLETETRQAEQRATEAEQRRAALEAELTEARAVKPQATAAPAAAARERTMRDVILNDPALQAMWLEGNRARAGRTYGPLLAQLQLPPEKAGQFMDAVMKRAEQQLDLAGTAQAQGVEGAEAVKTLAHQLQEEWVNSQRELLGEEGFAQFKEFERTAQVRALVEKLAGSLVLDAEKLTPAQAQQLMQAVATATPKYAAGETAELTSVNWELADAQARQILSPAQFAAYERGVRLDVRLEKVLGEVVKAEKLTRN